MVDATRYNTGNELGSNKLEDLSDNAKNIDNFANGENESFPDRFGVVRRTIAGMESDHVDQINAHDVEHDLQIAAHESEHDAQISAHESEFDIKMAGMAFSRVGTFTTGATLTDMRQTLLWEVSQGGDGREYGWTGAFAPSGKVVSAGSSPTPISDGNWVDRTEDRLRSDLNVVVKTFNSVADMAADTTLVVGQIVETISYYSDWIVTSSKRIGGNKYKISSTNNCLLVDGGSCVSLVNGLFAICLFGNGYDVHMWGAKGDAVSFDTVPIQFAIDYVSSLGRANIELKLDLGRTYLVNKNISNDYAVKLKAGCILKGITSGYENGYGTSINSVSGFPQIVLDFNSWGGVIGASLTPTTPTSYILEQETGSVIEGIGVSCAMPPSAAFPSQTLRYRRYFNNNVTCIHGVTTTSSDISSPNIYIRGCDIGYCGGTAIVVDSGKLSMDYSSVVNVGHGWVKLTSSTDSVISNNEFQSFGYIDVEATGFDAGTGTALRFRNNRVGNDALNGQYMVNVANTTQCTVKGNLFQAAKKGAALRIAGFAYANDNIFKECRIGIVATNGISSSTGNYFKGANYRKSTMEAGCVFSISSNIITSKQFIPLVGQTMQFVGTSAPTGVSLNTDYYVINGNIDAGTFQVSSTLGGTAISVSGNGTNCLITYTSPATDGVALVLGTQQSKVSQFNYSFDVSQNAIPAVHENSGILVVDENHKPRSFIHEIDKTKQTTPALVGFCSGDLKFYGGYPYLAKGVPLYDESAAPDQYLFVQDFYFTEDGDGLVFTFNNSNITATFNKMYTIKTLSFDGGSVQINSGDTITGATSGASAIVRNVRLESGAWASGTATGTLSLETITLSPGAFTDNENLTVGGTIKAVANGVLVSKQLGAWLYPTAKYGCFYTNTINDTTNYPIYPESVNAWNISSLGAGQVTHVSGYTFLMELYSDGVNNRPTVMKGMAS